MRQNDPSGIISLSLRPDERLLFRSLRRLAPLAALLVMPLWGCVTTKAYEGPELTKSEVSVIHVTYRHGVFIGIFGMFPIPGPRHNTTVTKLDDYGTPWLGGEFRVRPGQHSATVVYIGRSPVDLCSGLGCVFQHWAKLVIDFTTEAGHEYRIPAERRDGRDWIWVEDITIGKAIAGEKPP